MRSPSVRSSPVSIPSAPTPFVVRAPGEFYFISGESGTVSGRWALGRGVSGGADRNPVPRTCA